MSSLGVREGAGVGGAGGAGKENRRGFAGAWSQQADPDCQHQPGWWVRCFPWASTAGQNLDLLAMQVGGEWGRVRASPSCIGTWHPSLFMVPPHWVFREQLRCCYYLIKACETLR